jgi:hypothetical protein
VATTNFIVINPGAATSLLVQPKVCKADMKHAGRLQNDGYRSNEGFRSFPRSPHARLPVYTVLKHGLVSFRY